MVDLLQHERSQALLSAGRQVLELFADMQAAPERFPLWHAHDAIAERIDAPQSLAADGLPLGDTLAEAIELMGAGLCNVSHPKYFGYISPKPHPATVLGDLLGSALNQTPGAWRAGPSATMIEAEVLHALRGLFDLPPVQGRLPGGVFTGGGTLANLIGLKLAREHWQARVGRDMPFSRARVYMSREGHFSVAKALDVLGFDPQVLVSVEVDSHGALQIDALAAQLAADIAQGLSPMCVIGMLGTTATGAIDPLQAIADCARQHDLWFHVDAAAGLALAALPEARAMMHGLREADSITFDPCKWMFAAFGVGCLLVRNGELLACSFWSGGPYWEEKGELDTFKMNLYGTRQFRSLGLWCLLRHLGEQGYRQALRGMIAAAASLREQVRADMRYSLVPDQGLMPVLAFRPQAASDQQVRQLVELCQQRGLGYPSLLDWQGRQYLRVAVSNPDTGVAHMHSFKQGLDGLLGELALLSDQEVQR